MKRQLKGLWHKARIGRLARKAGAKVIRPRSVLNPECIQFAQGCRIMDGARIQCYKDFGGRQYHPKFLLGTGSIIGYNFTALVADELCIGKDTILASNVMITTENHGMDPESDIPYHAQPLVTGPVVIGEGCWIGEDVKIMPGVTIGDKCVIAAGAVVTKDIPACSIAAGVPAKVIKQYDFQSHRWKSL